MDDVDAVNAQIARNMLESGDWVTARLDGVAYLEKSPLLFWLIASSYRIFGVHDWAARIPIALAAIALCWLTARFGAWAFGSRAGAYAGLSLSTCVGMFLFTRVLIPDVMLTLTVTAAMWAFLRALEEDEAHPSRWAFWLAVSLGLGLLLKGLIAVVLPAGAALVYLAYTRQLFLARTWQRLRPVSGLVVLVAMAAPWHVLATLRNPPYFDFTLHSGPGQYRGFFWFYVINEHVLRFLNMRYPRDYSTVPRLAFWLSQLVWLFPWSVFSPAVARLGFKPVNRAGRARLLALCWIGFLMLFFTFSTTQEYYSMPCYPAMALLLASAMVSESAWIHRGSRFVAVFAASAAIAGFVILFLVRGLPAPGDISSALTQNPEAYTLSLGHIGDLTLRSFAYLRLPLALASAAFLVGALGAWRFSGLPAKDSVGTVPQLSRAGMRSFVSIALMMALFLFAARQALVVFDPYLSSRPLAEKLVQAPEGRLIIDGQYYPLSSIFFYANRTGLLLNGRANNLEYGSYAPDAPPVFLDDTELQRLWSRADRYYLVTFRSELPRLVRLVGRSALHLVAESGGKYVFTNQAIGSPQHQT